MSELADEKSGAISFLPGASVGDIVGKDVGFNVLQRERGNRVSILRKLQRKGGTAVSQSSTHGNSVGPRVGSEVSAMTSKKTFASPHISLESQARYTHRSRPV